MTNSEVIPVVAAIFLQTKQVLAFRRANHKDQAKLWEFPGGKVEQGESEADALRREIYEELQIELGSLEFLNRQITEVGSLSIQLSCYISKQHLARLPKSTDHDEIRWVTKDQAMMLEWAKPDLPALDLLIKQGLI